MSDPKSPDLVIINALRIIARFDEILAENKLLHARIADHQELNELLNRVESAEKLCDYWEARAKAAEKSLSNVLMNMRSAWNGQKTQ